MPSPSTDVISLQHGGGAARKMTEGNRQSGQEMDPHRDVSAASRSCFGTRQWEYSVVIVAVWNAEGGEEEAERNREWADRVWRALLPFTTGVYAVDIDRFSRPAEDIAHEVSLAFGKIGLQRLQALKRKMDPDSLLTATVPLLF
uniref:Berberine/berberine-like domain-containing protein n=1 Tax=Chromera velia CCMP2878 TaxID=1169474 RepID=A0A0G4FSD4_9ALVE|eukprot:Cvel_18528.t1-p1 / transcript=Cvel_18528.t1 / gene=Cvel_18528 / organism=Chromera_velia_CCMP2878 / gene_product=hypothetical protein / transcript_product=hypothetical protein / location=Cvel_scaffold1540:40295-40999(-) / protein_length=143 / sequence_SO=supercontig / SO=protein_coding / is_pseudo=false